jgi:hypothetical protein
MKDILKVMGLGTAIAVAYSAGFWLWENVLEEKFDDVKEYLESKRTKED